MAKLTNLAQVLNRAMPDLLELEQATQPAELFAQIKAVLDRDPNVVAETLFAAVVFDIVCNSKGESEREEKRAICELYEEALMLRTGERTTSDLEEWMRRRVEGGEE
jgi:hypothetical protein